MLVVLPIGGFLSGQQLDDFERLKLVVLSDFFGAVFHFSTSSSVLLFNV